MSGEARKIRLIMELRRAGVIDTRVLSAIERVPREMFVPQPFLDQAYENTALPIGQGQTVSQPLVVALMSQALEVGERMKVLEIGTGSGYQAAVLAKLCRRVYTIERHKPLLVEAEARFRTLHIHNITAIAADGTRGWPEQAPFDRILVTAAAAERPQTLIDQLGEGGVMVLPVGSQGGEQVVMRLRKEGGEVRHETLFPVRFVPLVAGALPE
jgi:protein-L-isoaspartate(D-aspartate) O-methyltransferase